MKLTKSKVNYNREYVKNDTKNLYIFTDNRNRTSGSGKIPDNSEYSKRFGLTGLKYPSVTSAKIRGLKNAFPITTQKQYCKGKSSSEGNWTDNDFEEFKEVIDDDFERIKKACVEKVYKEIIFPPKGVLNGSISKLTFSRTPKLFNYIVKKEIELKEFEP